MGSAFNLEISTALVATAFVTTADKTVTHVEFSSRYECILRVKLLRARMATEGNILDVPPGVFPDPNLATAIASFRASLGEDVEAKLVKGGEEGFTDQVG